MNAAAGGRVPWPAHRAVRRRALAWGVLGGVLLVGVYFGVLTVANSAGHALDELGRLWYWMLPLVLGFAAQIGLFAYAREATRDKHDIHTRGVVTSGSASTLSMAACCAHHLTDVLPLVGLAGAATVLAAYQGLFLLLGVLSNLVGLVYVLGMLRRHGLYPHRPSALSSLLRWPFDRMVTPTLGVSGLVFTGVLVAALF